MSKLAHSHQPTMDEIERRHEMTRDQEADEMLRRMSVEQLKQGYNRAVAQLNLLDAFDAEEMNHEDRGTGHPGLEQAMSPAGEIWQMKQARHFRRLYESARGDCLAELKRRGVPIEWSVNPSTIGIQK